MNDSPLTEFIAVASLLGLFGLAIFSYQQSNEIDSLRKLTEQQAIRIETMEKTLLMSR
jgi:hypothetical protein